jgi:PHD/YefM family antitoxin component YafN of YafNO toxin-antitoxin module
MPLITPFKGLLIMLSIAANDLKTRGIAAIEASLAHQPEATISVRGKERFVVMPLAQYNFFRECELELALLQSKADVAAGRYRSITAQEHFAEIERELSRAN